MIAQKQNIGDQRGGFSPFMFGILAGIALFSASIRGHLQNELQRAEEAKLERTRQETQALARAVESAIMTETSATYAADITLNRIMPYADGTTGRTAGGSAAQVNTFQAGPMGRVMVGLTDDGYVRNELATAVGDLTQSPLGARSDIAIVDIAALRTRQMELSLKNLDQEAGLLYYFWNRQNRFPTDQAEYKAQVNAVSGLRDFWGQDFTYTAVDANNGGLAFTSPWGEARSISVTMAVTTSPSTPPPVGLDCNNVTALAAATPGTACSDGSIYAGNLGGTYLITTISGCGYEPGGTNATKASTTFTPTCSGATDSITKLWSDAILAHEGATSLTNGLANTNQLIADAQRLNPAAAYCYHMDVNGKTDWYLPASNELHILYLNRTAIGGFASAQYWSSSEGASHYSHRRVFTTGSQNSGFKAYGNLVRCVRRAN